MSSRTASRLLAAILMAGGIATIFIAALHIVLGSASIPVASAVNATVDSEDRFYATIFAGYGLALLYASRDVIDRARLISFLAGLFFAGAFSRIIAWFAKGPPHPFFIAMLVIEMVLPLIIWRLQFYLRAQS